MVKSESQIGTVCGPLTNQEVHVEVCQRRTHHFRIPNIKNMNNEHFFFTIITLVLKDTVAAPCPCSTAYLYFDVGAQRRSRPGSNTCLQGKRVEI